MNTISTKINAILLATIVAIAPVCASENQSTIIVSEEQDMANTQDSVVWYKKCTTKHVIAGLAVTAIGLYALAIRKNKIAGPIALLTALFCAKKNIAEVKDGNKKDVESKDVDSKKGDISVDNEKPQIKNTEKPQDLDTHEKRQVNLVQENTENHKPAEATLENQETVEPKVSSIDPTQNQPKNEQPVITLGNVEKNIQPTHEAPLHVKAQESVMDAVRGLKNWVTKGLLESDDLSNN